MCVGLARDEAVSELAAQELERFCRQRLAGYRAAVR
jgi:hypothetical protein